MNLYRSFGSLMENWVREGGPQSDSAWLGNSDEGSPTSSPDMDATLNCESLDSGVETASSVMSVHTACGSVSMDGTDIDTITGEGERDRLSPASVSPVLYEPSPASSSSPIFCPATPRESATALHLKLEQALERTQPRREWNQECQADVEVSKQRNRASWYLKRHISTIATGQRSESFRPAKTASPLTPIRKISEPRRRPLSLRYDQRPFVEKLEPLGEEEREGLSPGFRYLEQVCQMLERIAKQQLHNRAIQMEMEALREHQTEQAPDACQCGAAHAEEDLCAHPRLRNEGTQRFASETLRRKDYPVGPLRQRSASDTTIATLHSRKFRSDSRGQHASTDDLLNDGDHNSQGSKKEEGNKLKNWRMKLISLRRGETMRAETRSQLHSSERTTAKRRLSNLIRKRLKTP